jgi:hypothetical protein
MSRLENIVERNKHPGRHRKSGVTMGVFMAMFVFLILILMIFTDLDESPTAPVDPVQPSPTAGDKRVNGVLLYRERPKAPRDAGVSGD